jgi:transcriptional regulator with XRE-family HTH domain
MPGTIIKQCRESKAYSQEYVAKQMGISQNAYSKIENNRTQLTVNHLKLLSKILDVEVLDLLRDEFEIRRPHELIDATANRKTTLFLLNNLQHQIKLKEKETHVLYAVIAALLKTTEQIIEEID